MFRLYLIPAYLCLIATPALLLAEKKVDDAFLGERLILIVPMVGAGTGQDPKRPLYAPLPGSASTNGISGFSFQLSDDGRFALVELIAPNRQAFKDILAAKRADVVVFERGKATLADVEKEFKKYKPSFDVTKFGGGAR